jgi:hypothetical protein
MIYRQHVSLLGQTESHARPTQVYWSRSSARRGCSCFRWIKKAWLRQNMPHFRNYWEVMVNSPFCWGGHGPCWPCWRSASDVVDRTVPAVTKAGCDEFKRFQREKIWMLLLPGRSKGAACLLLQVKVTTKLIKLLHYYSTSWLGTAQSDTCMDQEEWTACMVCRRICSTPNYASPNLTNLVFPESIVEFTSTSSSGVDTS